MDELLAFGIAIMLSFWGSLQLGIVNVQVIHTALTKGKRSALQMALGGALPELVYASLALLAVNELHKFKNAIEILGLIIIPVFIGLGFYFLFKKPASIKQKENSSNYFITGFYLAMLNPQLIIYWTAMFFYVAQYVQMGTVAKLMLVFGAAVGAFLALYFFAALAIKYKSFILNKLGSKLDKIVGGLFLFLGLMELVKVFLKW